MGNCLMTRKIANFIFGVSIFFTLLMMSFVANAQDSRSALKYYQRNTEFVLRNAAKLIEPHLTPRERRIQRSITLQVPATGVMLAQASPGEIVISGGTSWVLEQFAVSNIANHELDYRGCDEEYVKYAGGMIMTNSLRMKNRRRPRGVYSPELFGRRFGGACKGFRTRMITPKNHGESMAIMIEASLVFLYLHELAHHVLRHVDNAPPDLNYSRKAEAAADAWAIEAGFRANYNILDGAPMMNLLGILGGSSLEAEVKQTHPLGIRRVRDMMRQARGILVSSDRHDAVKWLDDNLRRAENLVPR